MGQSTTAINGCDGVIKIDNDAGVPVDVSGSANSVGMERSVRISDGVFTFGTDQPIRKTCGKDAAISLKIVYTTEEAEALQLLNDWYENHHKDARSVVIELPDSNPGSDRYTYECLLEKLNIEVEAGSPDPILVDVDLKPTGTFTWANIGS